MGNLSGKHRVTSWRLVYHRICLIRLPPAPEPFWMLRWGQKSLALLGIEAQIPTLQSRHSICLHCVSVPFLSVQYVLALSHGNVISSLPPRNTRCLSGVRVGRKPAILVKRKSLPWSRNDPWRPSCFRAFYQLQFHFTFEYYPLATASKCCSHFPDTGPSDCAACVRHTEGWATRFNVNPLKTKRICFI
jgi:hypothetical protein